MGLEIRPYRSSDIGALHRICLLTGWDGHDASGHYSDPVLLSHFYAAPYVTHDPDLCLVVTEDGDVAGYILGTADSTAFHDWSERHWFPALRERWPLPDTHEVSADAALRRRLHAGYEPPPYVADYPAHLHIDLLPSVQHRGCGAQLMQRFLGLLRRRGCPAVHLVVSTANARAIAFYHKCGFHRIEVGSNHQALGLLLG